ncbi:MAG: helix-hairpin-helix domain-containing protein [Geovibrio sp.]|nr:helix-hairpin-helix domain-containing protein [Geovibrio sp.]
MIKNRVFENCLNELSRLPGIGRKTAGRLALHVLKMKQEDVKRLAESIVYLKEKTVFCSVCGGISEAPVCSVCEDRYRVRSPDMRCGGTEGYFHHRKHRELQRALSQFLGRKGFPRWTGIGAG